MGGAAQWRGQELMVQEAGVLKSSKGIQVHGIFLWIYSLMANELISVIMYRQSTFCKIHDYDSINRVTFCFMCKNFDKKGESGYQNIFAMRFRCRGSIYTCNMARVCAGQFYLSRRNSTSTASFHK